MNEELDLLELFFAFWKKKIWLILAIVIGAIIGFACTKYAIVPEYASSVRMVLAKSSGDVASALTDASVGITQSDITLNQKLITTYGEIIKSKKICNTVIDNLKLDMTYNELYKCINVSSVKDTEIILLKITTRDPVLSAKIAKEMMNVFRDTINQIYNIKNIIILDEAEENDKPVNVNYTKNIVIFAFAFFAVSAIVIFLIYYFDNTIKTEENVQQLTGLPVLATIPKSKQGKGGSKNA